MRLILATAILCFCTQCQTRLSPAEQASLRSVRIMPGTMAAGARKDPSFLNPKTAEGITSGTAVALGGASGALAGAIIVQTSEAIARSRHRGEIQALRRIAPEETAAMVTRHLEEKLKSDPFFGPRLASSDPSAQVQVEIKVQMLVPSRNQDGFHTPAIGGVLTLKSASGKVLRRIGLGTNGVRVRGDQRTSPDAAMPLKSYISDPALLRAHTDYTAERLAAAFALKLGQAVGTQGKKVTPDI